MPLALFIEFLVDFDVPAAQPHGQAHITVERVDRASESFTGDDDVRTHRQPAGW